MKTSFKHSYFYKFLIGIKEQNKKNPNTYIKTFVYFTEMKGGLN